VYCPLYLFNLNFLRLALGRALASFLSSFSVVGLMWGQWVIDFLIFFTVLFFLFMGSVGI
jgi:hypothetical protein